MKKMFLKIMEIKNKKLIDEIKKMSRKLKLKFQHNWTSPRVN